MLTDAWPSLSSCTPQSKDANFLTAVVSSYTVVKETRIIGRGLAPGTTVRRMSGFMRMIRVMRMIGTGMKKPNEHWVVFLRHGAWREGDERLVTLHAWCEGDGIQTRRNTTQGTGH